MSDVPRGYAIGLALTPSNPPRGYAVGLEFAPGVTPPERTDVDLQPGGAFPALSIAFTGTLGARYFERMQATPGGVFPALGSHATAFEGVIAARYFEHVNATPNGTFPPPVLPAFVGMATAIYDSRVDRLDATATIGRYEQAAWQSTAHTSSFEDAAAGRALLQDVAQQAARLQSQLHGISESADRLSTVQREHAQQAAPLRFGNVSRMQVALRIDVAVTGRAQQAAPLRTSAQWHWQIADMLHRMFGSVYQYAGIKRDMGLRTPPVPRNSPGYAIGLEFAPEFDAPRDWGELQHWFFGSSNRTARFIREPVQQGRYQDAMRPLPADQYDPGPNPEPPDPEPPDPTVTIVVEIRRTYIVQNSISLTRVDNSEELHPLTFSLELDADSWTFQWSASLHHAAGAHLGRQANGEVPQMLATVNGQQFMLRLESRSLDERFIPSRWSVSGRGQAAILSAPHAPAQSFSNTSERTAAQLANDVLTINGVPMGWDLDWQIDDWQVPAAAWTHQGTYITALTDIATAVGAYIQPHPTEQTLHVLPRYPALPWAWDDVTPHYDLPAGMAEIRGTEYVERTPYNRIYVGGESVGVFGHITRAGTAGELLAPQVLHPLITSAVAQRMRGGAELANTGNQEHVAITTQVLPETGIILPGKFVRHSFPQASGRRLFGIVRKVSINYSMPKLRQTITLETHPNV